MDAEYIDSQLDEMQKLLGVIKGAVWGMEDMLLALKNEVAGSLSDVVDCREAQGYGDEKDKMGQPVNESISDEITSFGPSPVNDPFVNLTLVEEDACACPNELKTGPEGEIDWNKIKDSFRRMAVEEAKKDSEEYIDNSLNGRQADANAMRSFWAQLRHGIVAREPKTLADLPILYDTDIELVVKQTLSSWWGQYYVDNCISFDQLQELYRVYKAEYEYTVTKYLVDEASYELSILTGM